MIEYDKFCRKKKMKSVLLTPGYFTLPKDKETLRQILYITEQFYKNFRPYDVAEELYIYKKYISDIFAEWYAIKI